MPLLKFDTVQTGSLAKGISPSTILLGTQYKIFKTMKNKEVSHSFQKYISFWKISRLQSLVLLVRATSRWVWNICAVIMRLEDGRTRLKPYTSNTSFTTKPVEEYTHFKFTNLKEIVPFMIKYEKIWYSQTGHSLQTACGKEKLQFACRITTHTSVTFIA